MKTQIIQLEAHDDIISARDKLVAAKANRIILVWPQKKRSLLDRKLDLMLLQRHSARLGVQLGLVTTRSEVRLLAQQVGIPVFRNLRKAQTERWRSIRRHTTLRNRASAAPRRRQIQKPETQPQPGWADRPLARALIFSLSLAAVFAVLAVILPSAEILVLPDREIISVDLTVLTNPALEKPLLAGELPVKSGTIIVEGRQSKAASGSIRIPEKPAVGRIEFSNLTEQVVRVPAGTVVTTLDSPPIRFETMSAVLVPAGTGEKKITAIQAQVPGSSGNLSIGVIQAVEGLLGLRLTARNPTPTRQGSDRTAIAPTRADRETLYRQLLTSLEKSAANELREQIPQDGLTGDFPLLETLEFEQVVEETYTPSEDQPAEKIELQLRLAFRYQYIRSADLQALALPILNASTPQSYDPVPGTAKIQHGQVLSPDRQGYLSWELTLSQAVQKEVQTGQVALASRGITPRTASRRLQASMEMQEPPVIRVSPSWWPWLPFLPYRIQVAVQMEG